MAVTLGHNQYGKAETRVVRVYRDADPHELVDYNVSVALSGDFADIHLDRRQREVPDHGRDEEHGQRVRQGARRAARQPESFGLALARHFVDDAEPVQRARIKLEMYPWVRLSHGGARTRTPSPATADTCAPRRSPTRAAGPWVVSGVKDLVLLKTTDSEFHGFLRDRYTTLPPTHDRIMATSVTAQWWHTDLDVDWAQVVRAALATMTDVFAGHHSLALQQTMFAMGEAMIERSRGSARCGSRCRTSTTSS